MNQVISKPVRGMLNIAHKPLGFSQPNKPLSINLETGSSLERTIYNNERS